MNELETYYVKSFLFLFVHGHGFGTWKEPCEGKCLDIPPESNSLTASFLDPSWTAQIGFVVTMLVAHYLRGRYAFAGLCNWGMSATRSVRLGSNVCNLVLFTRVGS